MLALLLAAAAGLGLGALAARTPRGTARRAVVATATVVAAAGALAASGAPTGTEGVDLILRAGLAAGCCLLASRAPQPWLLASGLAALAGTVASGSHHQVEILLAGAGAGMTVARLSAEPPERRTSPSGAIAAGLLVNAALRFGRPHPFGLSAGLAALIVVPLVLGGLLRLATRRRRRRRIINAIGLTVLTIAVVGGGGLLASLLAEFHLQEGVRQVQLGLGAVRANRAGESASHLDLAAGEFARGNHYLHLAAPALALPVMGQQLRAMRAVGFSGQHLATVGATTLTAAHMRDLHLVDGAVPVDKIAALDGPLQQAVATLVSTEDHLAKTGSPWLLRPVRERVESLLTKVGKARHESEVVLAAVRLVPAIVGAHEPRHYFLAVQTPAESRGTGGVIGNFGEITAVNGHLSLSRRGRSRQLNEALNASGSHVDAPAEYQARYGRFQPQLEWRNVTLSPDFPTVARVIEDLYPRSQGEPIDGVISIDPIALTDLLRVLGPVDVPVDPGPRIVTLSPTGAAAELLHGQYEVFNRPDRIDFLDLTTQAVWTRLTSGTLPPFPDVLQALAPSMKGKHLMMASTHPDEQALFHKIGADGAVAPVQGDYLGLVTQNAAGNKIDWYLHRSLSYEVKIGPNRRVSAQVTVALHNQAPSTGEAPLIINGSLGAGTTPGQNKLYFSLYTPWELAGATLDGHPLLLDPNRELGRNVFSAFVTVPPSSTATLQLSLIGRYTGAPPYRLDVLHQPLIWPDEVRVGVDGAAAMRLHATFDATTDRTLISGN